MTNYRFLILCLIFFLAAATPAPGQSQSQSLHLTRPDRLTYPALQFKPPQAERLKLPNGMIIYILADHELPLVNIHAVMKAGAYFDPDGKEGLAELTGTLMRTGGTELMSGTAIDEELEALAIDINFAAQMENCTISFSSLKNNLDRGMEILSRIMRQPVFAEDKLLLARNLKMEELRRIGDDHQQFAFREFNRVLYRGNPRGRLPSLTSVEKITRDDLQKFHQRYYNPDNIMVAITGDITKTEALALLEEYFGDWPKRGTPAEILPPPNSLQAGLFYLAKDAPQSVVITGRFAPAKKSADFYPFTVLDFILGSGGFRSRIFQEIRTNQGLAYSAGSFYRPKSDYGVLGTYAMTKSSTTGKALSLLRSITARIKSESIGAGELAWAKKSLNNSFIFSFRSTEQIAKQQLMLEFDQLPQDYLLTYQDRITRVSSEEVASVAGRYLLPEETVTLVMGQEKDFDQPLTAFGRVETLVPHD
jgi:zinc protease